MARRPLYLAFGWCCVATGAVWFFPPRPRVLPPCCHGITHACGGRAHAHAHARPEGDCLRLHRPHLLCGVRHACLARLEPATSHAPRLPGHSLFGKTALHIACCTLICMLIAERGFVAPRPHAPLLGQDRCTAQYPNARTPLGVWHALPHRILFIPSFMPIPHSFQRRLSLSKPEEARIQTACGEDGVGFRWGGVGRPQPPARRALMHATPPSPHHPLQQGESMYPLPASQGAKFSFVMLCLPQILSSTARRSAFQSMQLLHEARCWLHALLVACIRDCLCT